jgi:cytochrome c
MRTYFFLAITTIWLATPSAPAFADADSARGKTVFSQCSGCHATTSQNKVGPHLAGVFGRTAGTVPGFSYSKAMAGSGTVWNEQTLDAFLAAPSKTVPGTSMPVALSSPQDRADVIAYLKTLTHP